MARTPTACTAIYLGSWFFAIASTLLTAFLLPSLLHQLPFLADTASLYVPCWYVYDASNTHFDNTAYTYATDYAIAVFMGYGAVTTSRCSRSKLRDRTVGLLTCMCVSVTMGGFCHQFFVGGYEALNEVTFRLLWSVCVGTVTMAGAYIGSIGSQVRRNEPRRHELPAIMPAIMLPHTPPLSTERVRLDIPSPLPPSPSHMCG